MKVCLLSSVHQALDNRIFYREARTLQRAGHEVTLIAVHDRDEIRDGVQILGLPRGSRWRRPLLWRTLLGRARATAADVYHFHDPELLLVIPLLRLRGGRRTIYDVHEANPDFVEVKDYMPAWLRHPLARALRRVEAPLASLHHALVFADDATPEAFARVRRPRAVLHNFPDLSLARGAAASLDTLATRDPVLLYLGGLERNRGSRLMVEAFAEVRRRCPDARLLLVGHFMPADLEDEVRRQLADRGLEGAVEIVGRVPFEAIGSQLERAALGWVPWQAFSKNEKNVPTKLFEYMAYGLPIVSSDLGSTRTFIDDGDNGRLVAPADAFAHADAIAALLEDRPGAAAMGLRGRERVLDRYNWQAVEGRLLELYDALA